MAQDFATAGAITAGHRCFPSRYIELHQIVTTAIVLGIRMANIHTSQITADVYLVS